MGTSLFSRCLVLFDTTHVVSLTFPDYAFLTCSFGPTESLSEASSVGAKLVV